MVIQKKQQQPSICGTQRQALIVKWTNGRFVIQCMCVSPTCILIVIPHSEQMDGPHSDPMVPHMHPYWAEPDAVLGFWALGLYILNGCIIHKWIVLIKGKKRRVKSPMLLDIRSHIYRETCVIPKVFEAESFSFKYNCTTSKHKSHSVEVELHYFK